MTMPANFQKEFEGFRDFLEELRKNVDTINQIKFDPEAEADAVNHPDHYNALAAVCSVCGSPIECIDVVRHLNFDLGNAVKYIWRAGQKDPETEIEDLKKAAWYLADEIEQLEKERAEREG